MYYAAVEESSKLAQEQGSYETFAGSPASKGQLQPDLWSVTPITEKEGTLDWKALRLNASKGLRNSLLLAPMPTASTSQILGYNECFEPFTTNLYTRRTLAGEYIMINKYLLKDLISRGLWSENLKQHIVVRNGSVQGIDTIPQELQNLYRTGWELKQRTLIEHAAARGAFICQSQSLNLFVADPTYAKLSSMHIFAWKQGLKTGCYYLRTKASVTAQKFTVDPGFLKGEHEADTTEEKTAEETPEQKVERVKTEKQAERQALKDRLAREYEESVQKNKEALENGDGEGCLMCSG
jgi:ribonucleoside-diphosphate reductase alpha chain